MDFLVYILKSAGVLAVFYIFYRLLLRKETFHRVNRVMLLCIAAMSFMLPLCVITIHKTMPASAQVSEVAALSEVEGIPASGTIWYSHLLFSLFIIGVVAVIAKTLVSICKVKRIIDTGKRRIVQDGFVIVVTEREIAPFSWFKYIVLSEDDMASLGCKEILLHERAHLEMNHTRDILFADIITAFQWFNPVVWMLRSDLRELHEYEADERVLSTGIDAKQYQYLLIKKAVGQSGYSVVNSFNHSTLKKSITMMLTKKSSSFALLKALYVIPLIGISLVATANTVTDYKVSENYSKVQSVVEELQDTLASAQTRTDTANVMQEEEPVPFARVQQKPSFQGGDANAFSQWVGKNLVYPADAKKKGIQGCVTLQFVVEKDGTVSNVHILMGRDNSLDQEALRVVSSSPKWTPGYIDGKPVKVVFNFPVIYQLPKAK